MTDEEFIADLRVRMYAALKNPMMSAFVHLDNSDCQRIADISGRTYFLHTGAKSPGYIDAICKKLTRLLAERVARQLTS